MTSRLTRPADGAGTGPFTEKQWGWCEKCQHAVWWWGSSQDVDGWLSGRLTITCDQGHHMEPWMELDAIAHLTGEDSSAFNTMIIDRKGRFV